MGTVYNDIIDLLRAIEICNSGEMKALLLNTLHRYMELPRNQKAMMHPNTKWWVQELAKKVGLKLVQTGLLDGFQLVHLATTPPPVYIYTPEPKSELLVDALLANLQGRML